MPVFTKGSFSVNLGIVSFGGEVDETDRQCAWELYCEIVSRVAVVGKVDERGNDIFVGEVLVESLNSLYNFFKESRGLMRRYPVGKMSSSHRAENHLGFFIAGMLETVLRPFLEKWQASYRHWWDTQADENLSPFDRQAQFPGLVELQSDWQAVRRFCREAADELANNYHLPKVTTLMPPEMKRQWQSETARVLSATGAGSKRD